MHDPWLLCTLSCMNFGGCKDIYCWIYIYNEYNTHIHIHMIDCNSNCPFVLDVKCFIYHSYTIYWYVLPFIVSICPCCISYICFSNNKNLTFIIKQVTLTCAIYMFLLTKCKGCDIVHMHCFVPAVKQNSLWNTWAQWPTIVYKKGPKGIITRERNMLRIIISAPN